MTLEAQLDLQKVGEALRVSIQRIGHATSHADDPETHRKGVQVMALLWAAVDMLDSLGTSTDPPNLRPAA